MFKTAFSTVACPEWTLERAISAAGEYGYDGVEFRTFGSGSTQFACDPALTAPDKVREMLFEAGVQAGPLATSIVFDEPISPPLLGRVLGDLERPVRLAKSAISLAGAIGCPYIRIFGFELSPRESRAAGLRRIVDRLVLTVDAVRNSGVRILLENGGSFSTATTLLEILDRIRSPSLGAAYSLPVAVTAGEDPIDGIALLGPRLWVTKVKDLTSEGDPCPLGEGAMPVTAFIRRLYERDFGGWVVYEWDRAWLRGLMPPQSVLPSAARRIYALTGAPATELPSQAAVAGA